MVVQGSIGILLALYLLVPSFTEAIHHGNWFPPPVIKEQMHSRVHTLQKTESPSAASNATPPTQTSVSLKDYASRIYVPFFKDYVVQFSGVFLILAALFIIIVVVGSSNAVNLTDGLDGLAAGCLIMVASCLAFIAFIANNRDLSAYLNILYIEGSGEIAIYLSAFVGACIGFLWYNGYPAQVFMGDTGSLALGGVIGVSAVLLKREFLLAVIGGIFVAEALSVILQVASYKLRNKKRIFLCAPLHHHFEYKGWPETKVVIRFWIVGLLLAIIGLISLKFQ
jgi:phospho-N-acetylmuramoyl-pentapeptide-transferase